MQLKVKLHQQLSDFTLDVDFQTSTNGVTALFGHSGSGKTSILRAVAGLTRVPGGTVILGQRSWQDGNTFVPPHKRATGYVFQEASLFPHLTVRKNLLFGYQRNHSGEHQLSLYDVIDLLGLEKLIDRSTLKLSGGERQRVAIGRALLNGPEILLMDEPLSALDHTARHGLYPYLESLHDELAIPVLYVSHDPNEVARLADQMLVIDQGRVIAQGKAAELLSRLDLPMASFEDATSIVEGKVSAHDDNFHLTTISTPGGNITVPRQALNTGRKVRVEVQARDVSLSRSAHADTSILNILPVKVIDTSVLDQSRLNVRLGLPDGQVLLSRITHKSAHSLQLEEGLELFAQVKSVALLQ